MEQQEWVHMLQLCLLKSIVVVEIACFSERCLALDLVRGFQPDRKRWTRDPQVTFALVVDLLEGVIVVEGLTRADQPHSQHTKLRLLASAPFSLDI